MFTENECLLENNMPGPVTSILAKCQAQVQVPCQQSGQKCFTVSDRKLPRIPVSWFSRDSVKGSLQKVKPLNCDKCQTPGKEAPGTASDPPLEKKKMLTD